MISFNQDLLILKRIGVIISKTLTITGGKSSVYLQRVKILNDIRIAKSYFFPLHHY